MTEPARRRVAVFTGNRAEYGLQFPILQAIAAHPALELYLLVSGAHLDQDFGYTLREIEADGFRVHREVRLEMGSDTLLGTVRAIGSGILALAPILEEIRPHWLVVYADRFEGLAALVTGTQMNIPTAHVEGGDLTEGGALDDSVRHAMSKLAHLHLTTNTQASERIRRLGEEPWRVHTVGFPVLDLVRQGRYATPEELEARFGLDPARPLAVFTQHSVTTEFELAESQVEPTLAALEDFARAGGQVVATYPNNDAGGKRIIGRLEAFARSGVPRIQVHRSVGRAAYHGLLHYCARVAPGVCCGNSSSGIKETPIFGCPAVNVGSRQRGRLRADNVIDTGYDRAEIHAALTRATRDTEFRARCARCENPYGTGRAGEHIADLLARIPIDRRLVRKDPPIRFGDRDQFAETGRLAPDEPGR